MLMLDYQTVANSYSRSSRTFSNRDGSYSTCCTSRDGMDFQSFCKSSTSEEIISLCRVWSLLKCEVLDRPYWRTRQC